MTYKFVTREEIDDAFYGNDLISKRMALRVLAERNAYREFGVFLLTTDHDFPATPSVVDDEAAKLLEKK